jgi:hypothetical protein
MQVSPLAETSERFTISVVPAGDGGELRLEWDTTRAAVAFAVKP